MTKKRESHSLKVVNHTPGRDWLIRSTLFVIFVGLVFLAYYWGNQYATEATAKFEQQNTYLKARSDEMEAERQEYLQRAAILESALKIDKQSIENMRIIIRDLESSQESLKQKLNFYRSILAPEDTSQGVKVHVFDLVKGNKSREFRLRVVVSQTALDHPFLKGDMSITVEGLQGNTKKSLSILELSKQQDSSLALGFRYFQILPKNHKTFDFTIPEGFTPKIVKVVINIKSGSVQKLNKTYQWDEELTSDVEQNKTEESA